MDFKHFLGQIISGYISHFPINHDIIYFKISSFVVNIFINNRHFYSSAMISRCLTAFIKLINL